MLSYSFSHLFPYPTIRPEQDAAIRFALEAFIEHGKKFVVLELGTGCGKSAIGVTVSRYLLQGRMPDELYLPGSYVLTTQKVLQEQYMHDFGPPSGDLVSIKSASNFQCGFHAANTCGETGRLLRDEHRGSPMWNKCMLDCPYKQAKAKFLASPAGMTNYSYFLAETMYAKKLLPRDLLILDEAHNTEAELSKFVEVSISERSAAELKLLWPGTDDTEKAVEWLRETYEPALSAHFQRMQGMVLQLNLSEKLKDKNFKQIASKMDALDKHICKLHRFLGLWDEDNWVLNVTPPASDRSGRRLELKPVDVGPYSHDMLFRFGKRVLMMSATIVNREVFCQTLGIDPAEVAFLSMDSPFPVENRPIYYAPVGSMAQSELDATLPKLAEMVKLILEQHKGQKGIIHAHTFRIANYLKQNIRSSRLLIHDSSNREQVIQKHMSSTKGTVLLSPSLSEGIDLKDDLSRFQILCKMPYPYLGDKLVKKRMARNRLWYPFQTAKSIVQSAGRSIRSESDHAVTYILDGNWERFFQQHHDLFPESFRKALQR